jgi:hypothetical protein
VEHRAIGDALIVDASAIENPVLDALDAVDPHLLTTLDIARLHPLHALNAAAFDPALSTGHANRMVILALDLDGSAAMAATTVGECKCLALNARCDKAAAMALDRAHLEAATPTATFDVGLNTASAAATILDSECISASATADLLVTATASLGVSATTARGCSGTIAAAFATAMLAWLGARRHRDRQSGDACG